MLTIINYGEHAHSVISMSTFCCWVKNIPRIQIIKCINTVLNTNINLARLICNIPALSLRNSLHAPASRVRIVLLNCAEEEGKVRRQAIKMKILESQMT